MRVTIVKPNNKESNFPVGSLLLFILGLLLAFNSEGVISGLFIFLGVLILIYGIYKFFRYYQIRNQLHVEDSGLMMSGIMSITIGLLTIILASFLTNAISIITGIWLIFSGISKLGTLNIYKDTHSKYFIVQFIVAILFVLLGLYSIFADNAILMILGIILLVYSLGDMINYFLHLKK